MAIPEQAPRILVPLGSLFLKGDRVLAYRGRANDRQRMHLFVDDQNVLEHLTDEQFLEQSAAEKLNPVTREELDSVDAGRAPKRFALASEKDVAELARRRAYVRAWQEAGRPSRTEANLAAIAQTVATRLWDRSAPGWRTVARWISCWIAWGEDDEALLPGKGGNRSDRFDPRARQLLSDTVTENYLVQTKPDAVSVHRSVVAAFDDWNAPYPTTEHMPVPSYQAVLDEIRAIDRYTLEFTRQGRRSAEHKFRTVGDGPVVLRHNQAWEMDHTTVDAIVVDEASGMPIGRGRVSCCLDRATRCCTSVTIGFEAPSASVALECLALGVMTKDKLLATVPDVGTWPCFGVPDEVVTDQGADFRSESFRECCRIIGADVEHTPVLKAWYRGRIERFFRTLSREVFHRVPGATFSNFFLRNKEAIPESVAVCTLEELRTWTIRYVVDIYNRKPHRSLGGKAPLELWNESVRLHGLKPPPSPRRMRLATSLPLWRTLQRYGVEVNGLVYQSNDLLRLRVRQDCPRQIRVLVDKDDLTRVRMVDPFNGNELVVPIRPSMEALVRGVSLHKHMMARALQRENPERLAGEQGTKKAYRLMDESMAAKRQKGGLLSRTEAARYWETLVRVRPTEEPPTVDATASGRSFVDEVLDGNMDEVAEPPPVEVCEPGPMAAQPAEAEPTEIAIVDVPRAAAKPRKSRRGKTVMTDGKDTEPQPIKDDLDGLVEALGLRVSKRKGDGA